MIKSIYRAVFMSHLTFNEIQMCGVTFHRITENARIFPIIFDFVIVSIEWRAIRRSVRRDA